jgi:hypothetical protein
LTSAEGFGTSRIYRRTRRANPSLCWRPTLPPRHVIAQRHDPIRVQRQTGRPNDLRWVEREIERWTKNRADHRPVDGVIDPVHPRRRVEAELRQQTWTRDQQMLERRRATDSPASQAMVVVTSAFLSVKTVEGVTGHIEARGPIPGDGFGRAIG